jgi:hypothetical protein
MPGAYLATNLITSDATITPSTEDAAYPQANLYDRQAANVFRSASKTALTLLIDFGASVQADTIALINHNLMAGATLGLKADGSNPPNTTVATPTYRAHDLWKGFTLVSARYWKLTIADSNPDNIQIGQFILGIRTALPRGRKIGSYSPMRERSNISGETYGGVFWNYHLFQRHKFNPSYRVGSAAELAILTALDETVYGNLHPFLYIPDVTAADCFYVRKEQNFEPQEYQGRIAGPELVHDYQMTLIEESRGLEVLV